MGDLLEKDLSFSEFLICISKNLKKFKPSSNIKVYTKIKKLILQPTYILDERLFITNKVMSKGDLMIRQRLSKKMHFRVYLKSYLGKEIISKS
jgi:hypothetical protein